MAADDSFYIATPIFYVNDVPHIGHAYTEVAADVLARWHRQAGDDTWLLTGTDEHGQKILRTATANGTTPQEWADRLVETAWQPLLSTIDIANDDFIRTTEPRHRTAVDELLQRCYDAGDIELDLYRGKYCVRCELYYSDDDLLPGDLCPIHKQPIEEFEEENYFFRLSRFEQRLLDWYAAHPGAIVPEFRGNEALGLIRSGLRDFSISRTSLDWGISLPWDDKHVAYVWFDALTNYLAAVEFDPPDLPWLMTPARADAAQRLAPWLVLVVLRRDEVEGPPVLRPGRPLASVVLRAGAPVPLPDLAESWMWAHAQLVRQGAGEGVGQALRGDPARNL